MYRVQVLTDVCWVNGCVGGGESCPLNPGVCMEGYQHVTAGRVLLPGHQVATHHAKVHGLLVGSIVKFQVVVVAGHCVFDVHGLDRNCNYLMSKIGVYSMELIFRIVQSC